MSDLAATPLHDLARTLSHYGKGRAVMDHITGILPALGLLDTENRAIAGELLRRASTGQNGAVQEAIAAALYDAGGEETKFADFDDAREKHRAHFPNCSDEH